MYPGAFESNKSGISPLEVLAQIAGAIIAIDFEGVVIFFNQGAERLYKRSAAEMVGHPLSDCYRYEFPNGEDPRDVLEVIRLAGRWSGDNLHIVHDGRQILVESEVTLFCNPSGEPIGYLAVIRDVTSRREEQLHRIVAAKRAREESVRAWEELRTHGKVLESFLENLPVAAYVKDEQGRYIFHNPAARSIAPRACRERRQDG